MVVAASACFAIIAVAVCVAIVVATPPKLPIPSPPPLSCHHHRHLLSRHRHHLSGHCHRHLLSHHRPRRLLSHHRPCLSRLVAVAAACPVTVIVASLHPRAAKPKPLASLYHLTRTHTQVAHKLHYADGTRPIQSARQNFDLRVRWHNTISTARAVVRFANHKRANHENDKFAMSSNLEDNGSRGGSTSWHTLR
jgi:hypothetical protein